MCGIAGLFVKTGKHKASVSLMTSTLNHRGPDFQGVDVEGAWGLGHSRLSIIDTSAKANQPFVSLCKNYKLTFNGEIYNYQELRKVLQGEGLSFTTASDTEVLLQSLIHWGIDKTLEKINGQFAFAFMDKKEGKLFLVRDRLGIKPLYYAFVNDSFAFASELKALKKVLPFELDEESLVEFMRFSYVAAPRTIYKGCYKLCAGQYLEVSLSEPSSYSLHYYWQSRDLLLQEAQEFDKKHLLKLLQDSISMRCRADVNVGAFLSSGIDSSVVVSIMSELSQKKVNTFSIGFGEDEFNEANKAREIAQYLGTNHHEKILCEKDAFEVIPHLSAVYDEPFADSSQIPTLLLSSFARNKVTVALSGDGGDEMFGGYVRYFWAEKLQKFSNQPKLIQYLRKEFVTKLSSLNSRVFTFLPLPSRLRYKLKKLAGLLNQSSYSYENLIPQCDYQSIFLKQPSKESYIKSFIDKNLSPFEQAMFVDMLTYLPNDILTKVDRASMAHSLEVRTPLLDHNIVQYAWQLPKEKSLSQAKLPLRKVLEDYLPKHLISSQKKGFAIPLAKWLRTGLKEWGNDLIHSQKLKNNPYLNEKEVMKKWQLHQSYKQDFEYDLWNILIYLSWEEKNLVS